MSEEVTPIVEVNALVLLPNWNVAVPFEVGATVKVSVCVVPAAIVRLPFLASPVIVILDAS